MGCGGSKKASGGAKKDAGAGGNSSGVASHQRQSMVKDHDLHSTVSVFDVYDGVPGSGAEDCIKLGDGGTAQVYEVTNKKSGTKYAMKVVNLTRIRDQSKKDMLLHEIKLIKMLDHPNTVKVYEVFKRLGYIYIVMELCTGGELFDKLYDQPVQPKEKAPRFIEADAKYLVKNMLSSLNYLHSNGIAHRDLKLENFIFTTKEKDAEIKLIDFGFSTNYLETGTMKEVVGTCYYLAPEVLKREYTQASDLWSLGVVIYMMVTGSVPFCGKNNDEIIASVKKETEDNDKMQNERLIPRLRKRRISEECIAFIMGLLTVDPQQRLSAGQALEHAWIVDEASSGGAATLGDNFTDAEFQESEDQLVLQLKNFKKMDMLKRTALLAMSLELSSEDLVMLNKSFAQADQNGDGLISFKEFQEMMEKKGVKDHAQVQAAFQAIDQDGAGLIQYSEFIAAALEEKELGEVAKVEAAFRRLDMDDSGTISVEELERMLPDGLDKAAVKDVLEAADCTDKDGLITLAEFKKALLGVAE